MKRVITKEPAAHKQLAQLGDIFNETESELAAFVGKSMIMTPGDLIFDNNIADGSVRYWCALRSCFAQAGEVRKPPTQEEMSQMLGMNRKTAAIHFNLLRATRWVTVLKVIKQNNLEMGYSYLLHDTRMKLDVVLKNDAGYMDFLLDNVQSSNKKLRYYCQSAIVQLPTYALGYLTQTQIEKRENYLTQLLGVQRLDSRKNFDVQNSDSGENADVQKTDSGKNTDVQKSDSEKNTDVQKSDNGENADVQKSDNGEILDVQKSDGGENADVQKSDSGENTDVQKSDSEDIYNTACVYTPTHSRISVGDNITTTTSGNVGGGCGDTPFEFFHTSKLLGEILWDMEHDQIHFGKKTVHALKNCLKRKQYESKDGKPFTWVCTEDKAVEMLIVIFDVKPNIPLKYLRTLIFDDSIDEFLLRPKQRKLLNEYHKRVNPDYQAQQHPSKRDETPLERFTYWLSSSSDKREYKPHGLREGQKVRALTDLPLFAAKAAAMGSLTLPTWITDLSVRQELIASGVEIDEATIDRVSNLSLCFADEDKAMDYETVCKALELGLLAVEED